MLYSFKRWSSERCISLRLPHPLKKRKEKAQAAAFKSGDEQAFADIYKQFQKPIAQYIRTRGGVWGISEEVALELTQEVFLKAYRFRENYSLEFALSTWLWTIAKNTISDYLRSKNGTSADFDSAVEELPSSDKTAEAWLLKKDQRKGFLKMMRSLTRLQKRVLWLRIVHQLSYQEISAVLGLSLTAVKNLAYRARSTLIETYGVAPALA